MARTNKKLTKSAIAKACSRHNFFLQICWNYERMQAAGYAYAMVPVIKELYDDNDERCRQLERHMQFYNTHPGASAVIFGADVALEESYETEMGDNLKVALMGPLAGIGDTIQAVLVTPPFNILAASLAVEGSWLAPVMATLPLIVLFLVRWPLFTFGYKRSVNVIEDVSGSAGFDQLQTAASVLGMTVIGGFVPSMLKSLTIKWAPGTTIEGDSGAISGVADIQKTLDAILPYLVPIVLVWFCYWMIKIKKITPLKALLILFVIMFAAGATGVI
ncbi:PTS system mannose-specific EIID component [bioreactor metagenome]|uniref:PTS system mannose-specific EIID component n=1 Tax=bioreactor metagenome TaxID=1076179 RepID=A0A645ETZ6_9ZZZZ